MTASVALILIQEGRVMPRVVFIGAVTQPQNYYSHHILEGATLRGGASCYQLLPLWKCPGNEVPQCERREENQESDQLFDSGYTLGADLGGCVCDRMSRNCSLTVTISAWRQLSSLGYTWPLLCGININSPSDLLQIFCSASAVCRETAC